MKELKNQINSVIRNIVKDFFADPKNYPCTNALILYYWYNNKEDLSKKDMAFAANGISMILLGLINKPYYNDILKLSNTAKTTWNKFVEKDASKEFFEVFKKYEKDIKRISIENLKEYLVSYI